jgi:hypothetical protein
VGVGDDTTLEKIKKFADTEGQGKVRWFESHWPLDNPEKKKSGLILSEQTNLALDACTHDWCIYLQADEVLHEGDSQEIARAIEEAHALQAEAVVFQYRHFYGSYDVVQKTRSAYRREVRAIRKSSGARSVGDAQSFLCFQSNSTFRKPNAVLTQARVFHYGWVRPPEAMKTKTHFMDQLYHGASESGSAPHTGTNYQYKRFWGLKLFSAAYPKETHPTWMSSRIQNQGWSWDWNRSPKAFHGRDVLKAALDGFETLTGYRPFEFKNYRLIS